MKKALILCVAFIFCVCLLCSCQLISKKENELPQWKTAYLDYIEAKKEALLYYELVHIDSDDIPELYLSGVAEAEGDSICSYKNGEVIEQQLKRIGGARYIERSGKFINQNGNMGNCYTDAYKLTEEGFIQTFSAHSREVYTFFNDEEYEISYECTIEGVPASKSEHDAAVEAAFDFEKSVRLGENEVKYDFIKQQISDWK